MKAKQRNLQTNTKRCITKKENGLLLKTVAQISSWLKSIAVNLHLWWIRSNELSEPLACDSWVPTGGKLNCNVLHAGIPWTAERQKSVTEQYLWLEMPGKPLLGLKSSVFLLVTVKSWWRMASLALCLLQRVAVEQKSSPYDWLQEGRCY